MQKPGLRGSRAAIIALVLGVGGCADYHHAPDASMTLAAPLAPVKESYHLAPGDLLSVKFYHNPELNEDVLVRPDGMITVQLIGDVQAAGQTPSDLAASLNQRYSNELAKPAVSVIVRTLGSAQVYVGGEVGKPGVVPLSNGLTAFQAIQVAGSFLKTAHQKQVILVRKAADGHLIGYTMDLRPIESGEHPELDVALAPLDVVYVPKSTIADVNQWVEQYIRNNLPITPGFAVAP